MSAEPGSIFDVETMAVSAWAGSLAIWYITEHRWPEFLAWLKAENFTGRPDQKSMNGGEAKPPELENFDACGKILYDFAANTEELAVDMTRKLVDG